MHHDESLHAYFSWRYATGQGYVHDPMMHGPLLFHMTALIYKLFGDSDITARIAPAIFGSVLVPLPYLLRRQLGRVSMLVASFLLLISPGLWYYGRFARNEAWCLVFTLLIFIGVVRWMDSRNVAWLHVAWINWALLFASKEISFIVLFVFVTFFVAALLLAHSRSSLAWLPALPAGILVFMAGLPAILGWRALPAIPFENPSFEKSARYAEQMLTSPQILLTLGWSVLWVAALVYLLRRDRFFGQLGEIRRGERGANALSAALASVPRRWLQLGLLVAGFLLVTVPLYTSLFTNIRGGLASGSFGQLFYWLAQQNVERGRQPWLYYVYMLPAYEPIPVLLGSAGVAYGVWWLRRRRDGSRNTQPPAGFDPDSEVPLLGAWRWDPTRWGVLQVSYALMIHWALLSLLIYSWAGEKMPWLSVHITLPFLMLGAVFGARALGWEEGWRPRRAPRARSVWLFVALAALVLRWTVYRMAGWSLEPGDSWTSPLVYGLGALLALALVAVWRLGRGRAARALATLAVAGLCVYTVRSSVQLSYFNGDVPVEQMVYTQTTPRVKAMVDAITAVSERTTGGKEAPLIYDQDVAWPFVWYLRDFGQQRYMAKGPSAAPAGDVQFALIGAEHDAKVRPYMRNYTAYRYPMRWWFPEQMYRQLTPPEPAQGAGPLAGLLAQARHVGGKVAALVRPENQAKVWRYLVYRRPDGTLDSTDMVLYVRNDLVGEFNAARF
jgi:uncharacterized protein (TIGR03663 family)